MSALIGLTEAQRAVLQLVRDNPGITMDRVPTQRRVMLSALVTVGLVSRKGSADGRAPGKYTLTDEGTRELNSK